jgi:uncharacterized Zn finger protein
MAWGSFDDDRLERQLLRRKIEDAAKNGENYVQLKVPPGNKLAHTFWGSAWCRHLEEHSHYPHRLPRGRNYLRQGHVYNLAIQPGLVTANVVGSAVYDVRVTIQPLPGERWDALKAKCAGQVGSLLDLLAGKLGEGVMRTITEPEDGLFPRSREIRFICTCPDEADMCKHVAAVLYGVGVQLDSQPDLLFRLRSVDPTELLATGARDALETAPSADAALEGEDLAALFGIELAPEPTPEPPTPPSADTKRRRARKPKNGE